jgi:CheY-like chemotaxis protein
MPQGGLLTIETAAIDEPSATSIPDAKPGPYVSLTVSDNGIGMDGETQSRAFEPFFTTKEVGRGTGLGLSIVHGIVKDTGGHITLQSEPGHGTEFRVYFPAALVSPAPVAQATPGPTFRGSETILLVEDEESLRNTLGKVLRRAGYQVLVAADGEQAIEMDLQTRPPAQMLLTDIVMPGLSGPELARYLLEVHPDLKVLYMSGYPTAAGAVPLLSRDSFMQKPFTAERLLRRVREVFDGCVSAPVRGLTRSSGGGC